ncbi:predicted protein [Chaetomium globosum CBS 148.51]|uniref:DUF7708 domain-containing protein n=1 Tax=Chaetomium globosum (strain ATCC 6205 / CBS 148.51 / DSM 1962 / NBRC 6347 / NRRL 1970) TaxID=306901 RepID=Q2HCL6_CHAGB|nr:uncharacterized protein CHGG_02038 [Chaetomium globosum CBS 148.51]EAQ93803.1 predicted protein [Chaetomium globosum CBS 148.51]
MPLSGPEGKHGENVPGVGVMLRHNPTPWGASWTASSRTWNRREPEIPLTPPPRGKFGSSIMLRRLRLKHTAFLKRQRNGCTIHPTTLALNTPFCGRLSPFHRATLGLICLHLVPSGQAFHDLGITAPYLMDPKTSAPREPRDIDETPPPAAGLLIIPSAFDAVAEHTSTGLSNQLQVRPLLWETQAVRRFSSPSVNTNQQRLTKHIDSARTAYARAFVAIQKSIKDVDATAILTHTSETDVAQAALELFKSPSSEDNGRVSRFIDVLHHYHGVFDVLSQAGDFAYLAVVWGGMKMLLMMAKNKKDLLIKVTDMLVEIGLTLSRIEVYASLFPTARMVELISMLYAAVADFLEEIILHFNRKSPLRKLVSSFVRPFDEKFGRAMDRIHRLETCIEKDAGLLHALQSASIAQHQLDAYLHGTHVKTTLNATAPPHPLAISPGTTTPHSPPPRHLHRHQSDPLPQLPLPSLLPRLPRGHLQRNRPRLEGMWVAQQRTLTPGVPSVYLIWAQGMTVHAAVAALVLQVLQQRPGAVAELGMLDVGVLERAGTSVWRLWEVFTYLMRMLGGCLVYISIGSAGEDEFAIVERFVRTVRAWDGPPIWVTMIHPYNEGFVGIEEATDLDGLYDVHPSLTITDALHHVLMLELDIHQVSDTIQTVLWEAAWRETRYASVGISFKSVVRVVLDVAEELSWTEVDGVPLLTEHGRELWMGGVQRWIDHPVASNCTRELVQRHLDIVPLALPDDIRAAISRHLKCLVIRIDESKAASFASRSMTQKQRDRVWDEIKAAVIPGSEAMFCTTIRELLLDTLENFAEVPCQNLRQAGSVLVKLLNDRFGVGGIWSKSMSNDEQVMVKGIKEAVMTGFTHTIVALSEPEVVEEVGPEITHGGPDGLDPDGLDPKGAIGYLGNPNGPVGRCGFTHLGHGLSGFSG